ncbi:hypothetical protein K402DRAFT_402478 [Aulographum hederae CBS 113979]|uniref:Secreted protein n=1 Tax=Aulographum hederae CBS 113979 TaxID=1176131 RepID=A0A6G1H6B8_9PEZI|nr:hypothetical protein K402DRAFT_402478 [Aulographum hederae CBS 113979]
MIFPTLLTASSLLLTLTTASPIAAPFNAAGSGLNFLRPPPPAKNVTTHLGGGLGIPLVVHPYSGWQNGLTRISHFSICEDYKLWGRCEWYKTQFNQCFGLSDYMTKRASSAIVHEAKLICHIYTDFTCGASGDSKDFKVWVDGYMDFRNVWNTDVDNKVHSYKCFDAGCKKARGCRGLETTTNTGHVWKRGNGTEVVVSGQVLPPAEIKA